MAGLMLNGSMIQGLVYNGNPVSAMYNGQMIWPTEEPTPVLPSYPIGYLRLYRSGSENQFSMSQLSINDSLATYSSVLYKGRYYGWGSWNNTDKDVLSKCVTGQPSQPASMNCISAEFYFSGEPSSGWRSVSWKTGTYYEPGYTWTAEFWGSADNFQRCLGSAVYTFQTGKTYTINLA